MSRALVALTIATALLVPAGASARSRHCRPYRSAAYPFAVHHHGSGDIAIGVLSGIVGGIILDRVLFPRPVVVRQPYYSPPRRPHAYRNDGYYDGRSNGYQSGYNTGYDAGYDHGRRYQKY